MEDIGSIVPKALKKQLLSRKPQVLEILPPLWSRIVGRLIAEHSKPTAFTEGTLTVSVSSPPWATQLHQMSEQIRAEVNGFLAGAVVRKVQVRYQPYVDREAAVHSSARLPAAEPPACSTEELSRLLWANGEMKLDPELAGVVERSFVKYFSRNGRRIDECL